MRLIDKNKLLREVSFVSNYLPCGLNSREDELRKWIDKQPEISLENKTSDWIPCSERLPDETGWYLCTLKGEAIEWDRFNTTNKQWWSKAVVAWMPLPDPYKGEVK